MSDFNKLDQMFHDLADTIAEAGSPTHDACRMLMASALGDITKGDGLADMLNIDPDRGRSITDNFVRNRIWVDDRVCAYVSPERGVMNELDSITWAMLAGVGAGDLDVKIDEPHPLFRLTEQGRQRAAKIISKVAK